MFTHMKKEIIHIWSHIKIQKPKVLLNLNKIQHFLNYTFNKQYRIITNMCPFNSAQEKINILMWSNTFFFFFYWLIITNSLIIIYLYGELFGLDYSAFRVKKHFFSCMVYTRVHLLTCALCGIVYIAATVVKKYWFFFWIVSRFWSLLCTLLVYC